MCDRDTKLYNILREIFSHTIGSIEAREPINKLLNLVPSLPGIRKKDPEIFNLALESLYRGLIGEISGYRIPNQDNPEIIRKQFVKFFNQIYRRRELDVRRGKNKTISLNEPSGRNQDSDSENTRLDNLADVTLSGLDALIEEEQLEKRKQQQEKMRIFMETELPNRLNQATNQNPQCTCYEIVKRHILQEPSQSLTKIAKEFNINYQTLYSHWQRTCKRELEKIGQEFERS